ncbi:SigE family RNA polymerase sigma factor [Actinocrispum wychmicini]|uniref:RNA polymerase sigma-70 factor (Sigma-E family) n=1 Tax=Actinocrispum wychmicini TaxID=1213861 RepID=A0A4R2JIZ3_9PSEU|nr:SigE family RNA polymerase sigma factor [Actinocrispum wychmicini]TCO58747.1 RNA polymerase sigma-70 factor (sigma-E family) [Actinocrispum wychmicini]
MRLHGGSRDLDPAFEDFVRSSSTSLLRTAYLLSGDRGHAEDLLQTTLLRVAWRWSAASSHPEAYARRVLVNLSRDRWRSLGRRVREVHQPDLRLLPQSVGDAADHIADRESLVPALRQLPTRQREVVVLRFFADLSVSDTAAVLGCSAGTVKAYTNRALTKLRDLLEDPREAEVRHS